MLRNTLLILILAAALIGCGTSPEPKQYVDYSSSSGFKVANVDSVSVENLEVLAKVWGFAKYHHPVFARETLNADYELFELLPNVAYATEDERNAVLLDWVKGLGEFKSAEEKLRKEIAEKGYTSPTDWEWLGDEELLGPELSGLLQDLRWAKRKKPSRYAYINGYVSFDAESTDAPFLGNDTGYNLLTLFRLWNMAEYYFPSVNITNKTWSEVLPEYIPKFLATGSVKWTTAELIAELSDTHSTMSNNPIYHFGSRLPVELGFVEGKLIVTDNRKYLAEGEEPVFELGDEIVTIDGHSPQYFVEHTRRYRSASNENALLREAAQLACHVANEKTRVEVMREGIHEELEAGAIGTREFSDRHNNWQESKTYYELLNDSVGYLYPGKFKNADGADIMERLKNTKAIIIDFRCYPSDFMPFEFVGRYFVPDKIQHVIFTKPVGKLPGYFMEEPESLGFKNDDHYKGKVVVLVNEQTQSSAEYQTMAFQATPNCIVIGSQTAGADGNVVRIPLPRNVSTLFSGIGVYYPNGTNTQRVGVRIDHYVTQTVEGIKAGRDEVLEKALEIINMP